MHPNLHFVYVRETYTTHAFEIWTDHKNLAYFQTARKLNRRQARWALDLSEYNFSFVHKPGRDHQQPDALSCRPDYDKGAEDNGDQVLIRPEMLQTIVDVGIADNSLLSDIRTSSRVEPRVQANVRNKLPGWLENDGFILWRNRVYVPNDRSLRERVIQAHHDPPAVGHPGRFKTTELVLRNYWWPRLHADVARFVRGCERCQRTKTFPTKPVGKLAPHLVPDRPWQIVSVDLISHLPPSHGYDAIVVIVDRFSKMIRLTPTNAELTSAGMARIFRDRVWCNFGLPERVISDRGPQFASSFTADLNNLLGIRSNLSTAYHPETDGQTERINQEIEQYLRLFVNFQQSDWHDWLPLAEFSYNDKIQVSTGYSPFYINYGQHPRKAYDPQASVRNASAEEFANRMQHIRDDANSALVKSAATMKRFYDTSHNSSPDYAPNDRVWLEATFLKTERPSKKLDDKRFGPFRVLRKVGQRAYMLELPRSWKIHPVFHTSLLRPFHPPSCPSQRQPTPPPPILIGDHMEQEVEDVLDERCRRGRMEYLVKWKGLPREECTWEPRAHLDDENGINAAFRHYLLRSGGR